MRSRTAAARAPADARPVCSGADPSIAQVALSVVLHRLDIALRELPAPARPRRRVQRQAVTTAAIFPPPPRGAVHRPSPPCRIVSSSRANDSWCPGCGNHAQTSRRVVSPDRCRCRPHRASWRRRHRSGAAVIAVTPGDLEAMRTPLMRGRAFADSDRPNSLRVAIVDTQLASRLWPGEDPIGKTIERGEHGAFTVVGMVRKSASKVWRQEPSRLEPPTSRTRKAADAPVALIAPRTAATRPAMRAVVGARGD